MNQVRYSPTTALASKETAGKDNSCILDVADMMRRQIGMRVLLDRPVIHIETRRSHATASKVAGRRLESTPQ
ncbi:hypothetical protein ACQP1G_09395 [Nocardia sp. CA-107356]|uniref:hypothetical protein n=1 Tax=Nocardia sp. CA-107356 TaxID=3239972 RepID=UPI003D91F59B